ncbi:membrane protein [Halogranum amylolyticum]|uniref:Membrane protein n=1 Tax=Halogranum amylolyticum TaxID=660520 RepID=A0A1H8PFR9_9EURY|nr:YihY/virulence factor BrkB family protein [Halogranum amylolyticum]SEO40760.1 membrane protein [Halogranum amylolyticum]
MTRLAGGVNVLTAVARTTIEKKIRYPAAALAYYAFVSFVPLLVLVFAVVGERVAVELSQTAPQFLTPPVRELVYQSITTANGRTGAGLLAVLVIGWSSTNFVGDVKTVVDRIEGDDEGNLGEWLRDAVVILGSIGLAAVAIVATSILFALPPAGLAVEVAAFLGLWLTLAATFVPLYYVPSRAVTSPTAALPGAVVTSFAWTTLHTFLHFYSVNAGQYAIYGVLSGIVILLTSLYLAASALLTGIVVNAELVAFRTGR